MRPFPTARTGRPWPAVVVTVVLCVLALGIAVVTVSATTAETAGALPAGFSEQTLISSLDGPMAVQFSPDGRVFIAEKNGLIREWDGFSDTTATVVADLRTQVYNQHDRGLMSILLAPNFPTDPTLYALYARDADIGGIAPKWGTPGVRNDPCPTPPGETADGCTASSRLSKFTLTGSVAGPEQVLIDDWCAQFPSHSVGDLAFGPDGYLYASAGDAANYNYADYGQAGSPLNPCGDPPAGVGGTQSVPTAEGGSLRAQDHQTPGDPQTLDGTVIRIDPATGQGAPGNPFASSPDANRRRIIAAGVRNPFRMAFRPGSGELWLGDVGWNSWEEVDRITDPLKGSIDNFGWPCREGGAVNGGFNIGLHLCDRIASGAEPTVSPYFSYNHANPVVIGDGCATASGSAISGLAFYQGGSYPSAYNGAMFMADYSRQCIWVMFPGADGLPDPATRVLFHPKGAVAVDLQIGPNGDLFYVDIAAGALKRIIYTGANLPPAAAISATPDRGNLPLRVTLSAAASSDPQGSALTYGWDLDGDGTYSDATGPTVTRTYSVAGAYNPAVRVTNAVGLSSVATTRVLAGTSPPVPVIAAPTAAQHWQVDDHIAFAGSATDAEDGTLPAAQLSWSLILHHCATINSCHEHVLTGYDGVASGAFDAPDHEYPAYLELRLTATDATGVAASTSVRLDPQVADISVQTDPRGLQAVLSSKSGPTPITAQAIVGSHLSLATAASQALGASGYAFRGWSDGQARVHDIIAPAGQTTYTASFDHVSGPDPRLVAAYSFDEGRGTTLLDRSGHGHDGTVAAGVWTTGHTGRGVSFNGTSTLVSIADHADLDPSSGLTIEAWVRPNGPAAWRPVVAKEGPGGSAYALFASDPTDRHPSGSATINGTAQTVPGAGAPATATLAAATWAHLALTFDGTTMRLYINATLAATRSQPGALTPSAGPLRLGGNTVTGQYFSGILDDVRVFTKALSPTEVLADRDLSVSTDPVPPTAPTALTAFGGRGRAVLTWSAATDNIGVATYDIHRSQTPGFTPGTATRIASVAGTTFTDTALAPGTYSYAVVARDAAGNASPSTSRASAVVLVDLTPPNVAVTSPIAGATMAGTVSLAANASDWGGMRSVAFRVDGVTVGAADPSYPFTGGWDTTTATNGQHRVVAVATDAAGNTATSAPVTVTVSNGAGN